ncbi:MAG: hypothetical protein LBS64_03200 [Spirochaetaceae bacterium]|nr:hypothetical protein [Spirochaetaceae bacterium]
MEKNKGGLRQRGPLLFGGGGSAGLAGWEGAGLAGLPTSQPLRTGEGSGFL